MGKKGKRTKWQALPMEEDTTTTTTSGNGGAAVGGYKKFRPFSTYNGDNSFKTAVLDAHRGYSSTARQQTNDVEHGLPEGGDDNRTTTSNGGYLTEKDQNAQTHSSASSMVNGHGGGYHRYNTSGRPYYKSRYQAQNYANRDSQSIHSSYSATHHHKNSGASSTTSSTTSSNYQNGGENGWRPHRHYNRPYNQFYGYNKENSGYSTTSHVAGNDEYTRITTPRQDVLFKKGYLSKPKRMEEGYLDAPSISPHPHQQPPLESQLSIHGEATEGGVAEFPPTEVDPTATLLAEDNSPLYFCPGFVDHNGYFHANPTFMPNTFDQFGQPIVMMPYPQPPPPPQQNGLPGEEAVSFETSDNNNGGVEECQPSGEVSEVVECEGGEAIKVAETSPEEIQFGDLVDTLEVPQEIIEPPSATIISNVEVVGRDEEATAIVAEDATQEPSTEEAQDGVPVNNAMPLNPASSSFYPQSSMYPFYPMVFTPQQLPPNTSIIPLADLYYNENYAGLAAELFGLTDTANIQSDDSTVPCDEAQLLPGEDDAVDAAAVTTDASAANDVDEEVKTVPVDQSTVLNGDHTSHEAAPATDEVVVEPSSTTRTIENVSDLAANSNLKVDVEEFHPRTPQYPTLAQAAHVSQQRSNRSYSNHAAVVQSSSSVSHDHYPRRRAEDDFRRRRFQENFNNRPPRRTFNGSSDSRGHADVAKPVEAKKVEVVPPTPAAAAVEKPTVSAQQQKTNKSGNKANSKRAIQASIKSLEESNIDLSKTSIAAAPTPSSTLDSNQWLVKTKGKKSRGVVAINMPEEDMFEVDEEEVVKGPEVIVQPEPVIRSSTPVIEEVVEEPVEEEKTPPKVTKSPSGNKKKSPNAKVAPVAAKPKGKGGKKSKTNTAGKGDNGSKGFEVIEPDFGVITRLKTEPIVSLDLELQEELANILNMNDIDVEELNVSMNKSIEEDPIFRSSSLPKSPRSEKDNVIDLDDLEALERSLMDFDLSGELKERMIEIIQSELEAPLGGDGSASEAEEEVVVIEEIKLVEEVPTIKSTIEEPKEEAAKNEEVIPEIQDNEENVVEDDQESQEEQIQVVNEKEEEEPEIEKEEQPEEFSPPQNTEEAEKQREEIPTEPPTSSDEEHCEQRELNIITSGMNLEESSAGSSSSSSSLSSPIPTDDGRDGSNSESDDVMTPPAILVEDQEKKIVLPSQLEGRLFPRDRIIEEEEKEQSKPDDTLKPLESVGITASVSKWLEEKSKEASHEPILRIPNDPQVAKLIFKAMYGVDLALDDNEDEDDDDEEDFETEDSLSADESDFEPDSRDALRDLLGRGAAGGGGGGHDKRDNQVPIDTDSDYMSDGQNIKPVASAGRVPSKQTTSASADQLKATPPSDAAAPGRVQPAKTCKVM